MKIAVLGTGSVGSTIGNKLLSLGHEVMMGSRSASNEKAIAFAAAHASASAGTFASACAFGEMIINCTKGEHTLAVFKSADRDSMKNKVIVDLSNPLDFSHGMPPVLSVCNTDSIGEQLQRELPDAHVVKSLNTMWCGIMVNPMLVGGGDHHVFMSGNSESAKSKTRTLLESFGWKPAFIMDLGDISTARGTEMYLPVWLRIYGATKSGEFNIRVVT